jgi:uncharacterized protein (DUF302 family)
MEYYFSKTLKKSFEESVIRTMEVLKSQGFGIISEIDIQAKLKEKLGVEFKKYLILGACSPSHAYRALQAEDKIGTVLPCNVIVIEQDVGMTEVAAINPVASMMAIDNPSLGPIVNEVRENLKKVIADL